MSARAKLDPKTDLRSAFDRFYAQNRAANKPVVDLLQHFAAKKNATPSQVALAWLPAKKPWIVPIPGTRNQAHLRENLAAIKLQLTPADLLGLDAAFAELDVHGGRMNRQQMQIVDTSA